MSKSDVDDVKIEQVDLRISIPIWEMYQSDSKKLYFSPESQLGRDPDPTVPAYYKSLLVSIK